MREPRARPTAPADRPQDVRRAPRAFESEKASGSDYDFDAEHPAADPADVAPEPRKRSRLWRRIAVFAGGTLIAAGLTLAAERLIADLYARHEWLGWAGLAVFALFVLAVGALVLREIGGLMRLRRLDRLRQRAADALAADDLMASKAITEELLSLYAGRPDMARPRTQLQADARNILDGAHLLHTAERDLMGPLDARARSLTASSARRVALVTAVSPRALIDIAFVVYESFRLARNLADLYGASPGLFGFLRLVRAILAHLAVTGGLVLTDGVIEQLVGQGLATRLSARLGEGVVNGLMTVRVGIAAMRVVRPLPFEALRSPVVTDFVGELANVASDQSTKKGRAG